MYVPCLTLRLIVPSVSASYPGPALGYEPWTRCIGILVMVGTNQNKFKPSVKAIKELYYHKFRGQGGEQ